MTEQAHSYIGPSGASRWTKCPLSAYLARFVGKVRSGQASIRGSVFHKGLEMAVVGEVEPWELIGQQLEVGQDPNTKAVIRGTFTQTMGEQVEELLAWVRRNVPVDAEIGVEVRVSAEHIHSELFGTVDIIARSGSRVWIIDAKTGRVLVDPGTTDAPNPQMALYGYMAGVMKSDQVTLVVYQPYAGDQAFKPWEISGQTLLAWV